MGEFVQVLFVNSFFIKIIAFEIRTKNLVFCFDWFLEFLWISMVCHLNAFHFLSWDVAEHEDLRHL